ncbi:MAG TPA: urate oxidase [Micromonosporaceae bacterium]|jgi:urate oxidase|nr:urate oxidase [Micromonosporaceae bacterium]
MGIVLGDNQYGKAETRLVRVTRDALRHELRDLTVTTTLAGDLDGTHLTGDNTNVLPTDSQKNTVYAFARRHGVGEPEDFGLLLARHFATAQPAITRARVSIVEHGWLRLADHSFQRTGGQARIATVSCDGEHAWVVSGLTGLVLLKTTDSEFWGYPKDDFTTLTETKDRVLATEVNARWRHGSAHGDWASSHDAVRAALVDAFVGTHSRSLQQTLYAMGCAVLERCPEVAEIRLSLPNKHHLLVDLAPFGLDNPNQVYVATDRPYGLIEGTVARDDAPPAGLAWW